MGYLKKYEIIGQQIDGDYKLIPENLFPLFLNTFACECDDKRLAAYDLQKNDKTWVLSDFYAEFSKEMPRWRSSVEITTFNSKVTDLRLFKDFEIKQKGNLLAKGTSSWFVMHSKTHHPVKLDEIKNKFPLEPDNIVALNSLKMRNFPEIKNTIMQYSVKLRDTDFNHHLNSVRYMQIALNEIDDDFFNTKKLSLLHIKFLKEAFWKDLLSIGHIIEGKKIFHTIKKHSPTGIEDICRIKTEWNN